LAPGTLCRLQQANGAADVEFTPDGKAGDFCVEVDPRAILVHESLKAASDLLLELIGQGEVLSPAARIEQSEIRTRLR
jgi:hypothetical protein